MPEDRVVGMRAKTASPRESPAGSRGRRAMMSDVAGVSRRMAVRP